jgi:hypothetical protein
MAVAEAAEATAAVAMWRRWQQWRWRRGVGGWRRGVLGGGGDGASAGVRRRGGSWR